MGKTIKDILDIGFDKNNKKIDYNTTEINFNVMQITSLDGIEKLKYLEIISLSGNQITSLQELSSLHNLKLIYCNDNKLTSLAGIELLPNLKGIQFMGNPCSYKYGAIDYITNKKCIEDLRKDIFSELHLKHDDELRGKAALIHSGLFDFKIK